MVSHREATIIRDLLTLGSLAPASEPNALCTLLLSATHARAILLYRYSRYDQVWRLQGSSGLGKSEPDSCSEEPGLPLPSAWQAISSGQSLIDLHRRAGIEARGVLPPSFASTKPASIRVFRNDVGTRVLLLSTNHEGEEPTSSTDYWTIVARVLGLLLRLWDLQEDLNEQERNVEQYRTNLVALLDILNSVSGTCPINNLYESTVDMLQKITRADAVVLRRYDEINGLLRLVAERGLSDELKQKIKCVAERPVFIDMFREKRAGVRPTVNPEAWDLGYMQATSVPLVASEKVVGSVSLLDRSGKYPSVDELRWLEVLGRCVGLMIHQVHEAESQWETAVLQERSHLAREIHDGFAQSLAGLQLLLEEQRSLLQDGDIDGALDVSGQLGLLADDAYSSVREEILALHDEASYEGGLDGFLNDYLPRFQRQWGIQCHVEVAPYDDGSESLDLQPAVQSQLTRIIQEALANVRKHAGATKVRVRVEGKHGEVHISIEDDGRGFDMKSIPTGAYGLRVMQERANGVGGNISIRSTPEHGTLLEVVLPTNFVALHGETP